MQQKNCWKLSIAKSEEKKQRKKVKDNFIGIDIALELKNKGKSNQRAKTPISI